MKGPAQAGRLDRQVSVERATTAASGYGQDVVTGWAPFATFYARFMPVRDGEAIQGGQFAAGSLARFQVRKSDATSQILVTDRLEFEGRRYSISGIKEIGFRKFLEISAEASDAQ